jgi:hypothetical protein
MRLVYWHGLIIKKEHPPMGRDVGLAERCYRLAGRKVGALETVAPSRNAT